MAIINPDSGPLPSGPDSSYISYMKKLSNAGITQIGYVHTSYGGRALSTVESEINTYGTLYAGLGLQGIFLDEVSNSVNQLSYYTSLYNYIKSNYPSWQNIFINPGTTTVPQYLSVSTNIMIYENSQANLPSTTFPDWVLCANSTALKSGWQYRFSGIAYNASLSQVSSLITQFHNKGIGYVYITDGNLGCCTYNNLASYFPSEASTVLSLN